MSRIPDEHTQLQLERIEKRMSDLCAEGQIKETRGSKAYREEMSALRDLYKKTREGAINEDDEV